MSLKCRREKRRRIPMISAEDDEYCIGCRKATLILFVKKGLIYKRLDLIFSDLLSLE